MSKVLDFIRAAGDVLLRTIRTAPFCCAAEKPDAVTARFAAQGLPRRKRGQNESSS